MTQQSKHQNRQHRLQQQQLSSLCPKAASGEGKVPHEPSPTAAEVTSLIIPSPNT
jgi:hypothetical protein